MSCWKTYRVKNRIEKITARLMTYQRMLLAQEKKYWMMYLIVKLMVNRRVIIESGVDISFNSWLDELFDGTFDSLRGGILDVL